MSQRRLWMAGSVVALAALGAGVVRAEGPAAPAGTDPLEVRVSVAGDSFLEGQTVTVELELRNRSHAAIALLDAHSKGVGFGTEIQFALPLTAFGLQGGGESLSLQENLPAGQMAAAVGTHPIEGYARLWKVIAPGEAMVGQYPRKVYETPTATLTYEVTYAKVDDAVAAGALYVRAGEPDRQSGFLAYRRATNPGLAVGDVFKAILSTDAFKNPARSSGSCTLPKVDKRPFSLEQALNQVSVSRPVYSYLTSADAWVIEKGAETHFVNAKADVVCGGRHTVLVDQIEIQKARTLTLANWDYTPEDLDAPFLAQVRTLGVKVERGKALTLSVPAISILPFLQKADEHGYVVEGSHWRKKK